MTGRLRMLNQLLTEAMQAGEWELCEALTNEILSFDEDDEEGNMMGETIVIIGDEGVVILDTEEDNVRIEK